MDSGGLGEDTLCCACPMKLNEHARKVDNAGSLNLMSCFGVDVAGDRAWLCSACRRNYGRHKSSGGTKRYLMTADKREARMRRHIRKRRKQEAMAAATTRVPSSSDRTSTATERAERASLRSAATSPVNDKTKKTSTSSSTAVVATSSLSDETSTSLAVSEPITTPRDHGLQGPVLLLDTLTGRLFAPSGAIHFGEQPSYPVNAMNMMMSQYHASQMYNNNMKNEVFAGFNNFNGFNSISNGFSNNNNSNNMYGSSNSNGVGSLLSIDNGELGDVDAADILSFNGHTNGIMNESDNVLVSSPSSSSGDDSITSPPPPFVPLSPSSDDSSSSIASSSSPVNDSLSSSSSPSPIGDRDTSAAASLLSSLSGPSSPMPILTSLPPASQAGAFVVPTSPLSLHPIGSCNIGTSMFGNTSHGMPYGTTMLMPASLPLPLPLLLDQDVDASPFNWPVDAQPMSMMPFTVGASLATKSRTSSNYKAPLVKTASLRPAAPILGHPVASSSLSSLPSYHERNGSPLPASGLIAGGGTSRGIGRGL